MSTNEEMQSLVDKKWVWIRIRTDTRTTLNKKGRKGQSYDDVIQGLLSKKETK